MSQVNRLLHANPTPDLDAYVRAGGGHGLPAARHRVAESTVDLLERAGLRGRGGAGYPTGLKWRSLLDDGTVRTVVVNAAEGEPGTFKDRMLIRNDVYQVLEGALIAARTVAAQDVVVAINAAYTTEIDLIEHAIAEIESAMWCEPGTIRIVTGPDEYLFGEETALLEVLDGRAPFPRVVPPYRHGATFGDGLFDAPATLVDNVETLANVPGILRHGAEWFRSVGTVESPGTMLCTVTGDAPRHGVAEFAMGTPVSTVLTHFGVDLDAVAAILPGVANPPLAASQLHVPLSYEGFAAAGSGVGSGALIVLSVDTDLHAVATGVSRFLAVESCGQCEPCKLDGLAIHEALVHGRDATARRLLGTITRGARCALAGEHERTVGRLIEMARVSDRDEQHPTRRVDEWPVVPLLDIVEERAVLDLAHLDKRPDWSRPRDGRDSHRSPADLYRATRVPYPDRLEPSDGATRSERADVRHLLVHLREAHARIAAALTTLRTSAPSEQRELLSGLADQLEEHHLIVERYVYPAVERERPDDGPDLTWYPREHERRAQHLLERIHRQRAVLSPRELDQLVVEVNILLLELDERLIPLLERSPREERLVDDVEAAVVDAQLAPAGAFDGDERRSG